MNFQKTKLNNGLTVIGEHNPENKSLSMGFFVRTGGQDEASDVLGVSHFLEHMVFKGSDQMSAQQINQEFDNIGANYNAYTSQDSTVYYGTVLPEYQDRLLKILANLMQPAIKLEDFEVERKVILEEIQRSNDDPGRLATYELMELYFRDHPLSRRVIGTTEIITKLTRDQMYDYYINHYSTQNMIFAVCGNYDWNKLITDLENTTKNLSSANVSRIYPEFSPIKAEKVINSGRFRQITNLLISPGFAIQDDLRFAAEILSIIIGDDDNSRIYWALIDSGLADMAYFTHYSSDNIGMFRGKVTTNPENIEQVSSIFKKILIDAQENGINQEELERAKRKFAVSLITRTTMPSERLFYLAEDYLYTEKYFSLNDLVKQIKEVSLSDINKVLEKRPFDQLSTVVFS